MDVHIMNVQGQVVYTEELSKENSGILNKVDLSAYPKGVYFIKVTTNDVTKTEKIILQ